MWITEKEKIKNISFQIVEAQKNIRILDSIKWDAQIEKDLKKSKFKQMPKIGPEYYAQNNDPGFEFDKKKEEFESIKNQITQKLGKEEPLAKLLYEICSEYQDTVEMIRARGTKAFWEWSRKLYGSSQDALSLSGLSFIQISQLLYQGLSRLHLSEPNQKTFDAAQAATLLEEKLKAYFSSSVANIRITEDITSDASAGGDTIKLRQGNLFTLNEIEQLEVHEGWVHIGTTQNGSLQKIAKWLAKSPPRGMATQEGLAFLMEILTFRATPQRLAQVINRMLGINKAEAGANFLELLEFYRTEGYNEDECIQSARRVFRGGVLEGQYPFTKDISYLKGMIEIMHFMSAAFTENRLELLPFLFAGKLNVKDIPLLYQKYREGIIDFPTYLPSQFQNPSGLICWISLFPFMKIMQDPHAIKTHQNQMKMTG